MVKPVTVLQPVPTFPPQKVMESGNYADFLAENQAKQKACSETAPCEEALFNLGFCYGYSKSPYYQPAKATDYFEELCRKYPQSPWAYQAKAWMDLLRRTVSAETGRRRLQGQLKTIEEQLKAKNQNIGDLQKQIERSRDIDLGIEQRERELLP